MPRYELAGETWQIEQTDEQLDELRMRLVGLEAQPAGTVD